jgi:PhoPQ-activated pathogenicity-related protein
VELTYSIANVFLLTTVFAAPTQAGGRALAEAERTALDHYVAAPDPSYRFEVADTADGDGFRTATLDLISQTWLTDKEVDRPVWRHWLLVVVPKQVRSTTGMLFIGGGANGREAPDKPDARLAQIALATGSVVAELKTVPNQPLTFVGDGKPRVEDEIIAYTWERYLTTGDPKWPARLPMTKAAVRAMDAVTAFCATDAGGKTKVERFVVAGASKRGWTTWSTAAVDDRVVGIVPIVIDTLNVAKSAAHHLAAYGFFAPALQDYEEMKLDRWIGKPEYAALMRIEDPYSYRARYTMPKLMLNATGDQYFLPDNSQLYFDDLPGPKYLRYVPNADHSLDGSDAAETLLAFYQHVLSGDPLPRLAWTLEKDGSIKVRTEDRPAAVKLWQATNPAARDFRMETLGAVWKRTDLAAEGKGGGYVARVQMPTKGWTAFFVELTYAREGGPPLKLTTQVRVLPDVLPFPAKAAR